MHRNLRGALCIAAITAPASAQSRLAKPTIDTLNHHIVRVMNSGPTAWTDTNGWKLTLERTLQPAEGSDGELAKPSTALVASGGQVVVNDWQTPRVGLYDRNGRFVRPLGRSGAGPGEYRRPQIALYLDTLVIYDDVLSRETIMTLDGKVVRSAPVPVKANACCEALAIDGHGRIGFSVFRGTGQWRWLSFDLNGQHVDSMIRPRAAEPLEWKYAISGGLATDRIPLGVTNQFLLLRNGSLLYGRTDRFEFIETRNGADTIRIFGRRGVNPEPVPQRVRDSVFHLATDQSADLRRIASLKDIPTEFPMWETIHQDGANNIWVAAAGRGPGQTRLDVFSPDGRFLGSVAAPFSRTTQFTIIGDHLTVVDGDENDLPRIRIFRIDRRGH
jgi:hypothetical protein